MAFSTLSSSTSLSPDDADQIHTTAKWARLVAILGFVFLGVLLIVGVLAGWLFYRMMALQAAASGQAPLIDPALFGLLYGLIFLVAVVIYFFPTLFLYQYAQRTLRALQTGFDPAQFSKGVGAQRSFFAYMGVLMIILVGLYTIGGIILCIAVSMVPSLPTLGPEG